MKTASFFTFKGQGRISIARYRPRFTPSGCHYFPALTPGRWFNSVEPAEYIERYSEILAALDPAETWLHLHELAGDVEPVLLCWEKPPLTWLCDLDQPHPHWCHRQLVARWFLEELGEEVAEWQPGDLEPTGPQLTLPLK